jgi:PAS domain S-box-containing protein
MTRFFREEHDIHSTGEVSGFDATGMDLQAIRSSLLNKGLLYFAFILPLALGLSLFRIFEHGWHPIYLFHISVTVLIVSGTVIRKRLSYRVRACLLLGVFLFIGASGLVVFGLVGGGMLVLVIFSVLAALAFGTRAGLIACFTCFAIFLATGAAVYSGIIAYTFDISLYATSITAWGISLSLFFMFLPVTVIALGVIHQHLDVSLQDLRDSEAQHRRLVDNLAGTFLYRYDTEGHLNYISSSVTHILGYTVEECLTHYSEYLTEHPDNQKVDQHAAQSLNGIRQPPIEVQLYCKNANMCWLEVSETPVFNRTGEVVAVEGVAHDVTERKREKGVLAAHLRLINFAVDHSVKELLQKSLDEAEELTESAIGFYHYVDDDKNTLTLQTWSTRTLQSICTAESSESHYPVSAAGVWVDCIHQRQPVIHNDYASLPHKKGLPEGHAPIIRELLVPVFRGETIVAVLGVGNKRSDYTDEDVRTVQTLADLAFETVVRRQTEEALRASEERFRMIFESNPEPVVLARLDDGTIIDVNRAFESAIEISRSESIGQRTTDLGFWTDLSKREPFRAQIQAEGEVNNFESDFRLSNGEVRDYLLSARLLIVNNESCILTVFRDISAEKAAQRVLLEMDQMKNEFISTAAHELNTPISAIMGFTEFLLDPEEFGGFSADQEHDFLDEIYERGTALSRIIDDLLDISRIESGNPIALDLQETDLDDVLFKAVDLYRTHHHGHLFEVNISDEPDRAIILVDRLRLIQVLENLLSNAVKYSEEGKEIIVNGKHGADGYEVKIQDNGIGMTPEQIDRIFDKFYRADASNTAIGGLGLGMSIVRQIVEAHGGSIRVESVVRKGTTVIFNLPAVRLSGE